MVSVFSFVETNANATDTGVPTNLNFGSTNVKNLAPSTYPITAGTKSYEKWVQGLWTGSFTKINNCQFWKSAGAYVTQESMYGNAKTSAYVATTVFVAPTTDASTIAIVAIPTADPAAANIGIDGSLTGSLTSSVSAYSDFLVLQASIGSGASAGAVNQKTFTWQFDEI